jgi:hypothetical protein
MAEREVAMPKILVIAYMGIICGLSTWTLLGEGPYSTTGVVHGVTSSGLGALPGVLFCLLMVTPLMPACVGYKGYSILSTSVALWVTLASWFYGGCLFFTLVNYFIPLG